MNNRLNELLEEIRLLEKSVEEELIRKEADLKYRVQKGRVIFEEELMELHRRFSKSLLRYVFGARISILLSAPVICSMIIPALLMDLGISMFQAICFPLYNIPKVLRRDHIVLDRHYLKYLNPLERLNCDYCSYFNGLASYVQEIGARTEQYWCPIKHASGSFRRHSRYHDFLDYGDAEAYRLRLEDLRNKYDAAD